MMTRRTALYLIGSCSVGAVGGLVAKAQFSTVGSSKQGMLRYPVSTDKICENCTWWDEVASNWVERVGGRRGLRYGFCRFNPIPPSGGFGVSQSFDRCSHFSRRDPDEEIKPNSDSTVQ